MLNYFVHESSFIDDGAVIGEGTKIWHFSHIMSGAIIGKNCVLGQNVFVYSNVNIGNNCRIQNNVSIYIGVEIEDDVFCGPSMVFTNNINPRSFIVSSHDAKKTVLKKGCSIGANATIIWGVTIGKYALVGAGAVVTKDVDDYALITGVPGKRTGWVCKCGIKLQEFNEFYSKCNSCGNKYKEDNNKLYPVV